MIQGKVHRAAIGMALVLLASLAAAGCSFSRSLFGGDVTAQIVTDDRINHNTPVQVELLVVFDDQLLQQLLAMPAQQWFAKREQVRRNYPGDTGYVSLYWEIVPGQPPIQETLSFGVGARAAVVFANYAAAGDHRERRDPHEDLRIHLQDSELFVGPLAR